MAFIYSKQTSQGPSENFWGRGLFFSIIAVAFLVLSIGSVSAVDFGFDNPNLPRIEPPAAPTTITFNNNTGSTNNSHYAECWITDQGIMCNVPDLYPTLDTRYVLDTGDNITGLSNLLGRLNITGNLSINNNGGSTNALRIVPSGVTPGNSGYLVIADNNQSGNTVPGIYIEKTTTTQPGASTSQSAMFFRVLYPQATTAAALGIYNILGGQLLDVNLNNTNTAVFRFIDGQITPATARLGGLRQYTGSYMKIGDPNDASSATGMTNTITYYDAGDGDIFNVDSNDTFMLRGYNLRPVLTTTASDKVLDIQGYNNEITLTSIGNSTTIGYRLANTLLAFGGANRYFGYFMNSQATGFTEAWNIYQNDSLPNFLRGRLTVNNTVDVNGNLLVLQNVNISQNLSVLGNATINQDVAIGDDLYVNDDTVTRDFNITSEFQAGYINKFTCGIGTQIMTGYLQSNGASFSATKGLIQSNSGSITGVGFMSSYSSIDIGCVSATDCISVFEARVNGTTRTSVQAPVISGVTTDTGNFTNIPRGVYNFSRGDQIGCYLNRTLGGGIVTLTANQPMGWIEVQYNE